MRVNLLPESHRPRRTVGTTIKRYALVGGTFLFALLTIGGTSAWQQYRDLTHRRAVVTGSLNETNGRVKELEAQRQRSASGLLRQQICTSLATPMDATVVIEQLAAQMPDGVAFASISLEVPGIDLPDGNAAALRKALAAEQHSKALRIGLQGIAANDAQVTSFVSQLSRSELFRNVKLARTFRVALGDEESPAFFVTLEVPLDRRFEVVDQEMAYGDH